MSRNLHYSEALLEGTRQLLENDPSVYVMGLGVNGPKGIYGTTLGLKEEFGEDRILEMPHSESAMTGMGIGSAIKGMKPIMVHQRVDFFLPAIQQLIHNGAKWNYIFGRQMEVPIVFRLIIGRGWGQGPQRSQSLQSLFAHIPGLRVVMPTTAHDAKGMLISAAEDPNPVIFLEHRWLHDSFGPVPEEMYEVSLEKAAIIAEGRDLTLVASSHMVLEARKAIELLKNEISVELIDIRSIKPLDKETIIKSVKKTGRLLVADPDWKTCGFAAEVIATISEQAFDHLKAPPVRLTYPDRHTPASWALANHYYPSAQAIAMEAHRLMNNPSKAQYLLQLLLKHREEGPLDVPEKLFLGPY